MLIRCCWCVNPYVKCVLALPVQILSAFGRCRFASSAGAKGTTARWRSTQRLPARASSLQLSIHVCIETRPLLDLHAIRPSRCLFSCKPGRLDRTELDHPPTVDLLRCQQHVQSEESNLSLEAFEDLSDECPLAARPLPSPACAKPSMAWFATSKWELTNGGQPRSTFAYVYCLGVMEYHGYGEDQEALWQSRHRTISCAGLLRTMWKPARLVHSVAESHTAGRVRRLPAFIISTLLSAIRKYSAFKHEHQPILVAFFWQAL